MSTADGTDIVLCACMAGHGRHWAWLYWPHGHSLGHSLVSSLVMASKVTRNYLTLKKKIELLEYAGKHPGVGVRELGEVFDCGKKQVGY